MPTEAQIKYPPQLWYLTNPNEPKEIRQLKTWFNKFRLENGNVELPADEIRDFLDWWSDFDQAVTTLMESVNDTLNKDKVDFILDAAHSDVDELFNPNGAES